MDDADKFRSFAPSETVERYHREDNAWRENHSERHRELDARIFHLEASREAIEKRLADGGTAFENIRNSISDLRKEIQADRKPMTRVQLFGFIVGPVLGVILLIASIVWQAARTPDRGEFTKMQEKVMEMQIQLQEVHDLVKRP